MTYEELLVKVSDPMAESYNGFNQALRAVMELHKPDLISYSDGSGCKCGNEYPCETIEAIKKELS